MQAKLAGWTTERDTLASAVKTMFDSATFGDARLDEDSAKQFVDQARALLQKVRNCATDIPACTP